MSGVVDRVGVQNVFVELSNADASDALWEMLGENPELLALLEWPANRRAILEDVKATTQMRWARPPEGGNPALWDSSRYTLVRCQSFLLARREYVGHLPGRKTRLPESRATELIVTDDILGGQTVLIGYHCVSEIQMGAGYRKDWKHRLRVMRHKREVRRICRRERHHKRQGRRTYSAGDGNYDGLTLPPLVSCWEGRPDIGTLGNRAVDIVSGPERADPVRTVRTKSDHKGVIASYPRQEKTG